MLLSGLSVGPVPSGVCGAGLLGALGCHLSKLLSVFALKKGLLGCAHYHHWLVTRKELNPTHIPGETSHGRDP